MTTKTSDLKKAFDAMYSLLYTDSDYQIISNVTRARLTRQFDDFMLLRGEFYNAVQRFVKSRHDTISSDREAQAFVLAYNFCCTEY